VHPFFWIIAALPAARGDTQLVPFLLWIAVVFFSIVVHEMGHALAFRYFGWHAHIVLYSFGGLAIPDASYGSRRQSPQSRMIISLAGPVAGFLLAGVVVLALFVLGYRVDFQSEFSFLNFTAGRGAWISNANAEQLVDDLLWVNILWGLINLLPVYPLDGGQFFREVLTLVNPRDGVRQSLLLSIGTGIAMAVFSYVRLESVYAAALFGYLAYMSYVALQSLGGFGRQNW
jgi:membrane-associated protease RseP (regulator of RpoE activity)